MYFQNEKIKKIRSFFSSRLFHFSDVEEYHQNVIIFSIFYFKLNFSEKTKIIFLEKSKVDDTIERIKTKRIHFIKSNSFNTKFQVNNDEFDWASRRASKKWEKKERKQKQNDEKERTKIE